MLSNEIFFFPSRWARDSTKTHFHKMDQLSSGQGKGNDAEFCVYLVWVNRSLKAQHAGNAAVSVVTIAVPWYWQSYRFPCRWQAGFAHVASGKTWTDSSSQERLLHVSSVNLGEIIHPELFLPYKRVCHRKRRICAGLWFVWFWFVSERSKEWSALRKEFYLRRSWQCLVSPFSAFNRKETMVFRR